MGSKRESMPMPEQVRTSATGVSEYTVVTHMPGAAPGARRRATPQEPNMWDYLHMLHKRWRLIVLVVLAVSAAAGAVIEMLPVVYRADVLVVLQAPNVRTGDQIIQVDSHKKLDALREQVESRRTLEEVIKKFNLYPELRGVASMEETFNHMRKAISLNVSAMSRAWLAGTSSGMAPMFCFRNSSCTASSVRTSFSSILSCASMKAEVLRRLSLC